MRNLTEDQIQSFWAKATILGDNDCWNWNFATNGVGYGKLKIAGSYWLAHRLAYTLRIGPIPNKLLLCHSCDNRLCVNPTHLFLGKHKDNTIDCIKKNRFAIGNRVVTSILTEDQVRKIKALYKPRKFGRHKIAKKLGLRASAVGGVINGGNWKHVI